MFRTSQKSVEICRIVYLVFLILLFKKKNYIYFHKLFKMFRSSQKSIKISRIIYLFIFIYLNKFII